MEEYAYILTFNDQDIRTLKDLEDAVLQAKQARLFKATCTFATDKSHGIHPHHGMPQLYFDQLNVIAKHLQEDDKSHQGKETLTLSDATSQTSSAANTRNTTGTIHMAMPTTQVATSDNTSDQGTATHIPTQQTFKLHQLKKRPDTTN